MSRLQPWLSKAKEVMMRLEVTLLEKQLQRFGRGLLIGLVFVAYPSLAHHSYAAFDSAHTRILKGTIKSIQWGNPHAEFKLIVEQGGGGKAQEWSIETHAPNILARYGWTKATLKYGDRVSVVCNPMVDDSHGCRLHTITFLDTGRTLETKLSVSLKSPSENTGEPPAQSGQLADKGTTSQTH